MMQQVYYLCENLLLSQYLHYIIRGTCADPDGGQGVQPPPPPLENYKAIGFLSNTGPDPLENHKATKPVINVGSSSARQRNAISMAFRWWVDGGPLLVIFGNSLLQAKRIFWQYLF